MFAFVTYLCTYSTRHCGDDFLLFNRIPDSIGKDIEKACQGIYPLHDVFIRKVKVLKKPKFDIGKLMEMHGEGGSKTVITDSGETVARPEGYEPPVQQSV